MDNTKRQLKVVLVDDERLIINGLRRMIPWAKYGCVVAGEAHDGLEGLATIRLLKPDILLTDIRMPNLDGLGMIAALLSELPDLQISVLTAHRDFEYARQAIRLGVTRYLLKPSKMPELVEAVEEMVKRCRELIPPEITEKPANAPDSEASSFVLNAAMEHIRQHYMEAISLESVAASVYVSQWHLSRLINQHTGQSFLQTVNSLRVRKAEELLLDPSLQIQQIAHQVGFGSAAHFTRVFKQINGATPGEHRRTC
ncbi:MAG: response regulator [Eubacteriales bacterium]|nr:response regulator [Eubacteriales bacterium]